MFKPAVIRKTLIKIIIIISYLTRIFKIVKCGKDVKHLVANTWEYKPIHWQDLLKLGLHTSMIEILPARKIHFNKEEW